MSRHSSSALEQLFSLLFIAAAGLVAVARFVWNIYTRRFDEMTGDNEQP